MGSLSLSRTLALLLAFIAAGVAADAQNCRTPPVYSGERASNQPAARCFAPNAAHTFSSRIVAAAPIPSIEYVGGPVVSNPEIVVVFWGSNVDRSTVSGIGGFYQVVLDCSVMDLLGEYDTLGLRPGTNQMIGHGSLKGTYTITPSQANSGIRVNDSNIENELVLQINNGALPAPRLDTGGRQNTIYMIYFPPGTTIIGPSGETSCVNFCGYHSATVKPNLYEGSNLRYAVFPDHGPSGGCYRKCGSASTSFDNLTSTSTHELGDTVTNALGAAYGMIGSPAGWYDDVFDEVADICVGQEATGPSGYTIQLLWSNLQKKCAQGPAQLALTAPATAIAGVPFTVRVAAQDSNSAPLVRYGATATFSSSDSAASLPADYLFDSSSASAAFSVTLRTPGIQTVAANDTRALSVKGAVSVDVVPAVNVSVGTTPAGLTYSVDGVVYTAPQVMTWASGSTHTLAVASAQTNAAGAQLLFQSWWDAGAATHTIVAPDSPASYTAYYSVAVTPQRPERAGRGASTSSAVTPSRQTSLRSWRRSVVIRKPDQRSEAQERR